jgi:hypothetical protein
MDRFIHRKKLEHYLRRLTQTINEAQRQQLLKLLAEEETTAQQPPKEGGKQRSTDSSLIFSGEPQPITRLPSIRRSRSVAASRTPLGVDHGKGRNDDIGCTQ